MAKAKTRFHRKTGRRAWLAWERMKAKFLRPTKRKAFTLATNSALKGGTRSKRRVSPSAWAILARRRWPSAYTSTGSPRQGSQRRASATPASRESLAPSWATTRVSVERSGKPFLWPE